MKKALLKNVPADLNLLPLGKTVVTNEPWFDGRITQYARHRYTIEKVNPKTYDLKEVDTDLIWRVKHEELHNHL